MEEQTALEPMKEEGLVGEGVGEGAGQGREDEAEAPDAICEGKEKGDLLPRLDGARTEQHNNCQVGRTESVDETVSVGPAQWPRLRTRLPSKRGRPL